jgi:hypothetical protein
MSHNSKVKDFALLLNTPLLIQGIETNNGSVEELFDTFEKNRFVVIRNFIQEPLITLVYRYMLMMSQIKQKETWEDGLVPEADNFYGDPLVESLMDIARASVEVISKRKLVPTFGYWRIYNQGNS